MVRVNLSVSVVPYAWPPLDNLPKPVDTGNWRPVALPWLVSGNPCNALVCLLNIDYLARNGSDAAFQMQAIGQFRARCQILVSDLVILFYSTETHVESQLGLAGIAVPHIRVHPLGAVSC